MTDRLARFLAAAGLQLRKMDEEHFVMFFDCGRDPSMDTWFSETALKWQSEDMCTVWVLSTAEAPDGPLGFFTLSAHQIIPDNVGKKDRAASPDNRSWVNSLRQAFPAQLLGKFALDQGQQGKGLGEILMACVYAKHVEASDAAGAKFLVVDVQEDRLISYYRDKFQFEQSSLPGAMAQMYRPTWVIRQELMEILG